MGEAFSVVFLFISNFVYFIIIYIIDRLCCFFIYLIIRGCVVSPFTVQLSLNVGKVRSVSS